MGDGAGQGGWDSSTRMINNTRLDSYCSCTSHTRSGRHPGLFPGQTSAPSPTRVAEMEQGCQWLWAPGTQPSSTEEAAQPSVCGPGLWVRLCPRLLLSPGAGREAEP